MHNHVQASLPPSDLATKKAASEVTTYPSGQVSCISCCPLYDDAAVGLCYLDTNLRYLHINRWLARLNGLPVEKHLGRTILEVLPHVAGGVADQLRQVMETRTPILDGMVEAETPARPGVLRTFMHDYHPVVSAGGQVIGVSCLVRDITKRRIAETRLEAKTAELEQSNRDLQLALENLTTLNELRHFSGRLINAQEAERQRIGRDLHDDLGQRMALVSLHLDRLARDHPELANAVSNSQSAVQDVSARIQRISYDLHPSRLSKLGLVLTLGVLCRDLSNQTDEFDVSWAASRVPKRIPDDVSLCIYRVAQEALHNAMRHSGVERVIVTLDGVSGRLRLMVRDAGRGIQLPVESTAGLGLISMRERVRLIGGTLSIRSAPGQGTHVTAEVPLERTDPGVQDYINYQMPRT